MPARRVGDLLPDHPGLGAGDPSGRVDAHPPHGVGLDQHRVGQVAQRGGVVPGALRRDLQAAVAGETDRCGTSSADRGSATAAGCWSTARFQARRASSQPGSSQVRMVADGWAARPSRPSRRPVRVRSAVVVIVPPRRRSVRVTVPIMRARWRDAIGQLADAGDDLRRPAATGGLARPAGVVARDPAGQLHA